MCIVLADIFITLAHSMFGNFSAVVVSSSAALASAALLAAPINLIFFHERQSRESNQFRDPNFEVLYNCTLKIIYSHFYLVLCVNLSHSSCTNEVGNSLIGTKFHFHESKSMNSYTT